MPIKYYRLRKNLPAFKAGTECYIEEAGHMVPCRGISYTIVHKDQLDKNPNILTDWFEEIKETTRWKPERYNKYYYIENTGWICSDTWRDAVSIDHERFEIGNCFQTEEEAKRVAEYLKALAVVRGDSTTKFTKGKNNWSVSYGTLSNRLFVANHISAIDYGIFGLPYFATKEDAQRSIELHKKEWLTIFGVKEEVCD